MKNITIEEPRLMRFGEKMDSRIYDVWTDEYGGKWVIPLRTANRHLKTTIGQLKSYIEELEAKDADNEQKLSTYKNEIKYFVSGMRTDQRVTQLKKENDKLKKINLNIKKNLSSVVATNLSLQYKISKLEKKLEEMK